MGNIPQDGIVLILIIIGMVVALGTLYTLKFIESRKGNKK